jgi:hypothetical protein
MKTLKTFVLEQKNTHMTHIEDLVFDGGVNGTRQAINFLRNLRDMLAGNSASKITATVKWDGAPAVFAGIDPRDGKFFIAKKGVFNKEPKVYKTASEIDADTSGDLAAKLKVALAEFSKLGIKSGVYQGDLMFTDDTKVETIDGEKYITFHPNTILYAVPFESELGRKIRSAKIGVVWHTTYTGTSFETMTAAFGKDIASKFNQVSTIWMDDATYKDYSGTATFTKQETAKVTAILSNAGKLFSVIDTVALNKMAADDELNMLINTYNNTKVRAGQRITDTRAHVKGLYDWIHARYQKDIDSKKTEKGKAAAEEKRQRIVKFFADHDQRRIAEIFQLSTLIADAKQLIISKMNEAGHISTFLKTSSGFRVTGVEGFVAIDHLTGGAVKIVDRLEFSKANFSPDVIKGWQR